MSFHLRGCSAQARRGRRMRLGVNRGEWYSLCLPHPKKFKLKPNQTRVFAVQLKPEDGDRDRYQLITPELELKYRRNITYVYLAFCNIK